MVENWQENVNDFKCKLCNFPLIVYEVQAKKNVTIFKAKCPVHGYGIIKIPTGEVSALIPTISDRIFRCFDCGAPSTVTQMIEKEPWELLKVTCPTHGPSRRYKINYHVFSEVWTHKQKQISKTTPEARTVPARKPIKIVGPPTQKPAEIIRDEVQFCRECGVKLKPDYVFCNKCGVKIIKRPIEKKKKDQNFCGECGSPLDHGYKFCIRCGTKL